MYKPGKPWQLNNSISNIFAVKKSAIAISTVALLLLQISTFCSDAEMDGCMEGRGMGDFWVERDVVVEISAQYLGCLLKENNDDKKE